MEFVKMTIIEKYKPKFLGILIPLILIIGLYSCMSTDDDQIGFIPSSENLLGDWDGSIVISYFLEDELIDESGTMFDLSFKDSESLSYFKNPIGDKFSYFYWDYKTSIDTIILNRQVNEYFRTQRYRVIKHTAERFIAYHEFKSTPIDSSFDKTRVTLKFDKLN